MVLCGYICVCVYVCMCVCMSLSVKSHFALALKCIFFLSRNISVQLIWVYSGYQEQLGASDMQIQYNYVILYTKTFTHLKMCLLTYFLTVYRTKICISAQIFLGFLYRNPDILALPGTFILQSVPNKAELQWHEF